MHCTALHCTAEIERKSNPTDKNQKRKERKNIQNFQFTIHLLHKTNNNNTTTTTTTTTTHSLEYIYIDIDIYTHTSIHGITTRRNIPIPSHTDNQSTCLITNCKFKHTVHSHHQHQHQHQHHYHTNLNNS